MEATERQAAELYDFLYKDEKRLASWYAQIFAGRITGVERTAVSATSTSETSKGGIPNVFGIESLVAESQNQSRKDSIDPHDMATVDVLAYLVNNEMLKENLEEASNGQIIITTGEFLVLDGSALKLVGSFFSDQVRLLRQKKPSQMTEIQRIELANMEGVSKLINELVLPSAFVMATDSGSQIGGTLHDEGMQEPIASYYFKHASGALPGVVCIGIKEIRNADTRIQLSNVFGPMKEFVEEMGKLLFTEDTIRITPLAIFRKLA